jgi:hypothetical protein
MDPIVDKIRKLQALADRAGSEAEAANAATRVQELLTKHNLEIGAVVLEAEKGFDAAADVVFRSITKHQINLATACDVLFDTKHYYTRRRWAYRRYDRGISFVGLSANVEASCITLSYLCASIESLLQAWKLSCETEFWERKEQYRSFRMGASARILEVARAHKRQAMEHNAASAELVHIGDAVAKKVLAKMKFSNWSVGGGWAGMFPGDKAAYNDGHHEGGRIDIHGARKNRMLR